MHIQNEAVKKKLKDFLGFYIHGDSANLVSSLRESKDNKTKIFYEIQELIDEAKKHNVELSSEELELDHFVEHTSVGDKDYTIHGTIEGPEENKYTIELELVIRS